MGFVDNKRWQFWDELNTFMFVNRGAFKYFIFALLGVPSAILAADEPVPQPSSNTNSTVIITNAAPVITVSTNGTGSGILPIVEGGTNSILSAKAEYEKKVAEAKKTWKAATNNLGIYHVIPAKDLFRLNGQDMKKPGPEIKETATVGVPHLAGISKLRNNMRAVIRINSTLGGPAEYKFIPEGEIVDGIEVLKINPKKGIVEIKVKGQTFPLELDKNAVVSSISPVRPSGASYRPGGSSGRSPGASSRKGMLKREGRITELREKQVKSGKGDGSQTPTNRPSGSGKSGLRGVPRRGGGQQGSLRMLRPIGADLYELPAFNEVVQKRIIDPLNISTQREIIRGQLLYETPTDLPRDKR
jgi:hypothetical protein